MEKLKNKKILITGHTGFKGSWLSYILEKQGAKIYGISLKPSKKNNLLFYQLGLNKSCTNYFHDINELKELKIIISKIKPEFIFHFAAQSLVSESYSDPILTFKTNVIGTQNILESIRDKTFVKTLIISTTDKVYENSNSQRPFEEQDKLGGDDPYSASKAASEILINSYSKSFKMNINIATVRAGNVIGFGDIAQNRIIPDILKSIFNKKKLSIRQLESSRPWQNILDVIYTYIKLLVFINQKKIKFSTWNLSPKSKNSYSVKKIIEIFEEISEKNIEFKVENKSKFKEKKYLSLNSDKSFSNLNLKDSISLKDTLKQIYELSVLFYENKNYKEELDRLIRKHITNEL